MPDKREVEVHGAYVASTRYLVSPIYVGDRASTWKIKRAVRKMEKRLASLRPYLKERRNV